MGTTHSGNASSAAGGILAPSVRGGTGAAHAFAMASLARYPGFVAALAERSGITIPMQRNGVLEIADDEPDATALRALSATGSRWLDPEEVRLEEPAISEMLAFGAAFHPSSASVEPLPLLDALRSAVASHDRVTVVREDCCELRASELGCSTLTNMESRFSSDHIVLAAGAWSPLIVGAGEAVRAVRPVRGQMIAFDGLPVRRVVLGAEGYLIPRSDGRTVAGSTEEAAGFESATSEEGIELIRRRAIRLCPALGGASVHSAWAGLRPCTPDGQPIIGPDPERPRLIIASGHSRNGILLAPLTAEVVADLVSGTRPAYDLIEFLPGRH